MGLSLKELKEYLIAKEGYEITPQSRQLQDLKDLLDDMYRVRSENTCNTHTGTSYDGNLSLGDMYEAGRALNPCSCNTYKGTICNCRSRTADTFCQCNLRIGCLCVDRTQTLPCKCYMRTNECDCRERTYDSGCTCNMRTNECVCEKASLGDDCVCDGRCSCNVEKRFE